jgi:hypothetical protein
MPMNVCKIVFADLDENCPKPDDCHFQCQKVFALNVLMEGVRTLKFQSKPIFVNTLIVL